MPWPLILGAVAVGTTLFNTYANVRAGKEQRKQAIEDQVDRINQLKRNQEFTEERVREMSLEYGDIVSYKMDMLRQKQLFDRQRLGYNILRSGVAITGSDTAGLMIRIQAHYDEMQARMQEKEYYYHRPRNNLDPEAVAASITSSQKAIRSTKSLAPWMTGAAVSQGVRQLGNDLSSYKPKDQKA